MTSPAESPVEQLFINILGDNFLCGFHMNQDWEIAIQGNGTNAHEASNAFSLAADRCKDAHEDLGISAERFAELEQIAEDDAHRQMAATYGEDWEQGEY